MHLIILDSKHEIMHYLSSMADNLEMDRKGLWVAKIVYSADTEAQTWVFHQSF